MQPSLQNLFDLTGRQALVTGGSRGLGLQMATALAQAGANVTLWARKADELAHAQNTLNAQGLTVRTQVVDLSALEDIPEHAQALLNEVGHIDILVNNAGMAWAAPAEATTDAQWQRVMNLNVNALFYLTREFAQRSMLPCGTGVVVNIASVGGLQGNAPDMKTIAYNTSKGAVVNLTRALASEWGPQGIRVNAICPGFFPTKLSSGLLDKTSNVVIAKTPLRRLGGNADLMGTVVYLASDASAYVTGQCLVVDGGASTTLFGDMLSGDVA